MDVLQIAENVPQRKLNARALAVKSVLPGLLAMHRWGRITIEGFAIATGVSYPQAQRMLLKLRLKGLVSSVRAVAAVGSGPVMYGLTGSLGYETLTEEVDGDIGPFRPPPTKVAFTSKFKHKHGLINALISARNSIESISGGFVDLERSEFRDFDRGGSGLTSISYNHNGAATTITPDAEFVAGIEGGEAKRFFVEYDRGTRSISSLRYSKLGETVINQLSRYWDMLPSQDGPFKVLFLTTSEARIQNIIDQSAAVLSGTRAGLTSDKVFRFATHHEAIGQACSRKPRIFGDFCGHIWISSASKEKLPLMRSGNLHLVSANGA